MDACRLRPIQILAALLIPAQLAMMRPVAAHSAGRRAGASPGVEAPVEVGTLSMRDILFAHHRMLGTEPDFRALATLDVDNRPPPFRPVRNPERERRYLLVLAERRLRAEFAAFDLDRRFRIRMPVDVLGYAEARGGIPLRSGLRHGFSMRDVTGGIRGFSLRFRNADAIGFIPAADADAGAKMLQQAGLRSLGAWAGEGVLTIELVFASALPVIPELPDAPLLANIVSAQVESRGRSLHSFAFPEASAAAAASRRDGYPPLQRVELSGLRIGMTLPEARSLALRQHPQALATGFYDGLADEPELGMPRCSGGLVADLRAFSLPLAQKDTYTACIAITPGDDAGPLAGRVAEVVQVQFLPGISAAEVRGRLEHDYGIPEELANGQLLWFGRDPGHEGPSELLQMRADLVELEEGGPQLKPGVLLSMTLRRTPHSD